MALINCPECGKEISDQAASCPSCGYPIKINTENSHFENENEQKDYTKIAAQAEKKIVESRITKGNYDTGKTTLVLGILALLVGIFCGGGFWLICSGLCLLIIGIGILSSLNKDKKRIQYLQNIADGKKEILICPYCKGTKVAFKMVQSEVHTSGQSARVADNLNPLHPLTHTNIQTSGTRSNASYKTLYICQDCGKTFDNPNRVWS